MWNQESEVCDPVSVFDHTSPGRESVRALMRLRQETRGVADYTIEFRTLAADSGWNLLPCVTLTSMDSLKDQLAPLDLPDGLDSLIALSIKINKRFIEREGERALSATIPLLARGGSCLLGLSLLRVQPVPHLPIFPAPSAAVEEPMQLGRTKLTPEERQRRFKEGRCFYCGQTGHLLVW